MPKLTSYQLQQLPQSMRMAYKSIFYGGYVPTSSRGDVSGDRQDFETILNYLGRPTHFAYQQGFNQPTGVLAEISKSVRYFLVPIYNLMLRPVIFMGVVCFLIALRLKRIRVKNQMTLTLIASLFLGATIRTALIILLDISSFPSITDGYLNVCYSFLLIASVASILILVQDQAQNFKIHFKLPVGRRSDFGKNRK
jgi:hypothetical protein